MHSELKKLPLFYEDVQALSRCTPSLSGLMCPVFRV
jgi:hypothetical protein